MRTDCSGTRCRSSRARRCARISRASVRCRSPKRCVSRARSRTRSTTRTSRGIVHRDVKPENVLLQDGHALVADFGIALALEQAGGERITRTGLALGTPQYMAPEQAAGERVLDARVDVYALGAVLHEMLAGEPPFAAPTRQAVVRRMMHELPPALATRRPDVAPFVDAAVQKALAKRPDDRFPSAAAFAAALAAPLEDVNSGATASEREHAPRGRTVSARWAMYAAVATLVVGAGGWPDRRSHPHSSDAGLTPRARWRARERRRPSRRRSRLRGDVSTLPLIVVDRTGRPLQRDSRRIVRGRRAFRPTDVAWRTARSAPDGRRATSG